MSKCLNITCKGCSYLHYDEQSYLCLKQANLENKFKVRIPDSKNIRTPEWCPLAGTVPNKKTKYQVISDG